MSGFTDFMANLGFGPSKADERAQANLRDARNVYNDLNPPELVQEHPQYATATDLGPSAMGGVSVNPEYNQAQIAQMAALSNLSKNGGHNAASDANLARIQQAENANARGQRGAIMQNANARGMGGSGSALLAQLNAAQNAQNNQSMEDLGVAGQEANTAIQAGQGAANIGANMQNNDFAQRASKAQAADAIARFNAGQKTGVSEYNTGAANDAQKFNTGLQQTQYQNNFQKRAGLSGASMAGVNYNQAAANTGAQQSGNLLSSAVKLGTAIAAWGGGKVPGTPVVHGDSSLNDMVPVTTSPGEVVVPRSLAKGGSAHDIANFVKNPPQIKPVAGPKNKEAMLSALKNLRSRRG